MSFDKAGEIIRDDGTSRRYKFTLQMGCNLFWNSFNARRLHGSEFHYPGRPARPAGTETVYRPKFDPRDTPARGCPSFGQTYSDKNDIG
jgi:hypothetical protein